jgi:hypothetical protein
MATVNDLLSQDEAIDHALEQLAWFINDDKVLPNRQILLADEDDTTPTTDYITVRILSDINKAGIYSESPMRYVMDAEGVETYIYSHILTVQLRTFIGSAFKDLRHIKTMLRNKNLNETYFHSDGTVAITQVGIVVNRPTIMNDQSTEPSAVMQVSLGYTWKYTENIGNYIEDILFTSSVQSREDGEDKQVSDETSIIP